MNSPTFKGTIAGMFCIIGLLILIATSCDNSPMCGGILYEITVTDANGEIILDDCGYQYVGSMLEQYKILTDGHRLNYVRSSDGAHVEYTYSVDCTILVIRK